MKSYAEYDWPMKNPNHRPFKHQTDTVEFIIRNKKAYVLSDIGTGKTLCVLWAIDVLRKLGAIRKTLVVTPLSTMKVVWAHEIFENFPHMRYAIAHGSKEERIRAIKSDAAVVIINHDGIKSVSRELIQEKFDVIVIDELTAYKNHKSDRTVTMKEIAASAKACWGLTGAPTPNSPSEAFGQAKVVNPNNPFLPRYFTKFRSMVEVEIAPRIFVPKSDAKDIVHKILQPSIRFERDQCLDLPPVLNQYLDVDMSSEQKEIYEAIKKELYYQFDNGEISAANAAVKLSKLLQVSAGAVKSDEGAVKYLDCSPKDDMILETFEEMDTKKLIVVSAFRASVEDLHRRMMSKKIKCEFIHGGISSNKRAGILDDFQYGKLEMLILQPQAVQHGVTLTSSNTIVWQSYVPSGEAYMQLNGRITRAGQTRKQFVKNLMCSSAEKHIINILTGKMDVSQQVLNCFVNRSL